jgi:xylitol oxidase
MGERNWAGNIEFRTHAIARPRHLDELREIVVAAGRIRAVGTKHSFNDIADGDVMVSLEGLPVDLVVDRDRSTIAVSAGASYADVAAALGDHQLALHNLASLPHISLAGAVVTGTHGSGDRAGNLATAVAAIEIMRSDGEVVRLDRGHADFAGAVVNLGALGVVVRLELDVEPAYEVEQHVFERLGWAALSPSFDAVTSAGDSVSLFTTYADDHVEQVWVKRRVPSRHAVLDLGGGLFGATAAIVDLHPIAGVSAESCTPQLGRRGPWSDRVPHFKIGFTPSSGDELQSELFVPRESALAAIDALRSIAGELAPLLKISEIRTIAGDDLWMSPHYGRDSVGFHFTWERDPEEVMPLVAKVESALAAFDARPHWAKLFTVAPRSPRHADFVDLVERFDPRHAFRNDWLAAIGI